MRKKHRANVILLGAENASKTAIVSVLEGDGYPKDYVRTIGADFTYVAGREANDEVTFQICDTAGRRIFQKFASIYVKTISNSSDSDFVSKILLFVVASDNPDVDYFEGLDLSDINNDTKCYLVISKFDINTLSSDAINKIKSQIENVFNNPLDDTFKLEARIFKCSAQDNVGIREIFEHLERVVMKKEQVPASANEEISFSTQWRRAPKKIPPRYRSRRAAPLKQANRKASKPSWGLSGFFKAFVSDIEAINKGKKPRDPKASAGSSNARRKTFPILDFGKVSRNSIIFGIL